MLPNRGPIGIFHPRYDEASARRPGDPHPGPPTTPALHNSVPPPIWESAFRRSALRALLPSHGCCACAEIFFTFNNPEPQRGSGDESTICSRIGVLRPMLLPSAILGLTARYEQISGDPLRTEAPWSVVPAGHTWFTGFCAAPWSTPWRSPDLAYPDVGADTSRKSPSATKLLSK